MGEMEGEGDLVFEGEDLTYDVLAEACGANEPSYSTRSTRNDKGKGVAGSSGLVSSFALIDDEDEMEEDIGLSSGEEDTSVFGIDDDDDE